MFFRMVWARVYEPIEDITPSTSTTTYESIDDLATFNPFNDWDNELAFSFTIE